MKRLLCVFFMVSVLIFCFGCQSYDGLSESKESGCFIIYYDKADESCIEDVAKILNDNIERITGNYNTDITGTSYKVYIYPDLTTFHEAIGRPDAADWLVGISPDRETVKMVSPNNAGTSHNYDQMLQVAVHEFTHSVIWGIEKESAIPIWLNEGIAEYEARQMNEKRKKSVRTMLTMESVPTLYEMKMCNSTEFGNMGGYELSYTIVEYIVSEYGYEKLNLLVRNPADFESAFGVSQADFETGWLDFITENYKTTYRPFIG